MRLTPSSRAPARYIAILTLWGALATSAAVARPGPPDPSNFDCPAPSIKIVGHNGFVGDPLGEYCVTARDFNNVPITNTPILIDFSPCGDVQLCTDQKDPGVVVDCVAQTVRKLTDANGVACFRVIGKRRPVDCFAAPSPCVEVFWDLPGNRTFICALYAPVFDLVNEPTVGVSGNDLSEFLHLFLECGIYLPAIDYNGNSVTDGDDLSKFLAAFFAGGSAVNCASAPDTKCP
jgi:hypothetical protein